MIDLNKCQLNTLNLLITLSMDAKQGDTKEDMPKQKGLFQKGRKQDDFESQHGKEEEGRLIGEGKASGIEGTEDKKR